MIANANANPQGTRFAGRRRWLYTLSAWGLIGLGLLVLAYNIELIGSAPWRQLVAYWPVVLIGWGGLHWWLGRAPLSFPAFPFVVERGTCEIGYLTVLAGDADLFVDSLESNGQLVVGRFPAQRGPRLKRRGLRTHLILEQRAARPFVGGDWQASLRKGLPWFVTLQADTGHFKLNLRDLTLTALRLHSFAGAVDLSLPLIGPGEANLKMTLGDLTLRLPAGLPVKIRLNAGRLAEIARDDPRLIAVAPEEWVTPNFSTAPNPFVVDLELKTGALHIVWD